MYVDVHTHLTHDRFGPDPRPYIERARAAGLVAIIVNGLEPRSNRRILEMDAEYPEIKPALGIYPIDAINDRLPEDLPFAVPPFSVDEEIDFIASQAKAGHLTAIGECGLDGHWVGEDTFPEQERVFLRLVEVAQDNQLPLIIHTRKRERRSMELLSHHGVERVNFHCYGGRVKWARQWAEQFGWWFSIPANASTNEAFQRMLETLPEERLLTETDAPFLAPQKGDLNEPANVVGTVRLLAKIRGWSEDQAQQRVWQNYQDLFAPDPQKNNEDQT